MIVIMIKKVNMNKSILKFRNSSKIVYIKGSVFSRKNLESDMNLTAYGNLKSRKYGNVISFHYTTITFFFLFN